jgi:hypothetical protein
LPNTVLLVQYFDQMAVYLNGHLVVTDCNAGIRPTPYHPPDQVAKRLAKALGITVSPYAVPDEYVAHLRQTRDWTLVSEHVQKQLKVQVPHAG